MTKTRVDSPRSTGFDELRLLAEIYWDLQTSRIAMSNRIGSGMIRPDLAEQLTDGAEQLEHAAGLAMVRCFRRVAPVEHAWSKATLGIGEHLLARLLGVIGDPVMAYPMRWVKGDAPEGHVCVPRRCGKNREGVEKHLVALPPHRRTISQLWQYCGHGDASLKRAKGMEQDDALALGNPRAKMIVHLMAEGCVKCVRSPFRPVYDLARAEYADREGWTPMHQHNAALRKTGKEILRALWTEVIRAAA